jgi:malate dehydrogenase (oxaloacetate-decarboxylating)
LAIQTSIILRIEMDKAVVSFGEVASVISSAGGDIIAIDVIRSGQESTTRDITVDVAETHYDEVVTAVEALKGIKLIHVSDRTFLMHLGGKIGIQAKMPIKNRDDLSRVYTPGVARVCMAIHEQQQKAYSQSRETPSRLSLMELLF